MGSMNRGAYTPLPGQPDVRWLSFEGVLLGPFERVTFMEFSAQRRGEFHWHAGHQVMLLLEGSFRFEKPQGEHIDLRPGDALIIPPGMPHNWASPDGRTELLEAVFQPLTPDRYGELACISSHAEHRNWRCLTLDLTVVMPLVEQVRRECVERSEASSVMVYGLMIALLGRVARASLRDDARSSVADHAVRILPALSHIETRYREPLAVADLARACHLSTSRFTQLFRQCTGVSPARYVDLYRLRKAESLLKYSSLRVGEVAAYLGYSSEYYFSRAFKRHSGMAPTSFRAADQRT
jgi:AraC-like DNA-binding protein/quercetin dioxygenase-like cupin family protein